jgi:hypothetical protein
LLEVNRLKDPLDELFAGPGHTNVHFQPRARTEREADALPGMLVMPADLNIADTSRDVIIHKVGRTAR